MLKAALIPLAFVALLALALAAAAFGRYVEVRRRRRQRVVEAPNSHHTWERVREIETRERWQDMPLDRIHEVNREEVKRLLARVSVFGTEGLRPQERTFLECMAEIAGVSGLGEPPGLSA
jgi:Flp pilus assembly protein TadB